MAKESKVTLLIGLALVLLIGIIVTDHFSVAQQQQPATLAPTSQPPMPATGGYLPPDQGVQSWQPLPAPQPRAAAPGRLQPLVPAPQPQPYVQQQPQLQPVPRPYELEPQHQNRAPAIPLPNQLQPQQRQHDYRSPFADHLQTAETVEPTTPEIAELAQLDRLTSATSTLVHYVKDNESLWAIAHRYYGDGNLWQRIADANPNRIMNNGGVRPGVRLLIPTDPSAAASQRVAQSQDNAGGLLSPSRGSQTITVEPGDTLSELAAEHLGSASKWKLLLEANKDKLRDPGSLRVGMKLKVPAVEEAQPSQQAEPQRRERVTPPAYQAPPMTLPQHATRTIRRYTVQSGDTLSAIAHRELGKENAWHDIYKANAAALDGDPNNLRVGMVLTLPQ